MNTLAENKKTDVPDITTNSITLLDMQTRLFLWQQRLEKLFHVKYAEIPKSIFIPLEDMKNILDGFAKLTEYDITGARLYLTFDDPHTVSVTGVMVPVGSKKGDPVEHDIVIDVNDPDNVNPDLGSDTYISAYDFTLPCPPMGNCIGISPLFGQQQG